MRRTNLDETALLIAIKYRNPVVQILLEHPEIDINLCDYNGQHPILFALQNGYYLEELLSRITEKEVLVTIFKQTEKWISNHNRALVHKHLRLFKKNKTINHFFFC